MKITRFRASFWNSHSSWVMARVFYIPIGKFQIFCMVAFSPLYKNRKLKKDGGKKKPSDEKIQFAIGKKSKCVNYGKLLNPRPKRVLTS